MGYLCFPWEFKTSRRRQQEKQAVNNFDLLDQGW